MIEVQQLSKRFTTGRGRNRRTVQAVDGVDFTAANGAITGLLGPNGAGKTTTLRIAAALIEPDGESLRLCWTYGWVDSARAAGLIDLPVLVRGSDTLITASGARMFAVYQEHLADLRRHCQEEPDGWIAFRRISPAPGREGLPFD